ncbi:MAG: hypothetical protein J6B37_02170 [Clostridia bacterium]|nr:hypothetical protein [Clostridia bacterium]
MTSQKSLNNVNANDFKRSLVGSILFPAIAFFVLFVFVTAPVIQYVTSESYLVAKEHNEYTMFLAPGSTFSYMFDLLPVGMLACGMLTALKSFGFLLSKKQVNVFLSLGIKRNTMFVNRLIPAIITLFVAVLVPMLIIFIINIACFGFSTHLLELFLYITSLLFVCGVTGFALASLMIMVSGNIVEVAVSTVSLTLIPFLAIYAGEGLMLTYLKGYTHIEEGGLVSLFNPWMMGTNLNEEYMHFSYDGMYDYSTYITSSEILRLLERNTTPDKFKVPEELQIDLGFTLSPILWTVVSVIALFVAVALFNRRKAEHANSLGKFSVSRAVICTFGVAGIVFVMAHTIGGEINLFLMFLIIALASAIAYFVAQLILTRKVKTAVKSLKWYGVLMGVWAVCMLVIGTGLFGTFNKVPDKAEVKSVSIEANALPCYIHYIYPWNEGEDFVESSTDESKTAVLSVYELLKNEKVKYGEDALDIVRLAIRDKDNNVKYRQFEIYSKETYLKYIQTIYSSDFLDAILENYLLEDIPENPKNDSTGYLKGFKWAFTDNDLLIEIGKEINYIDDVNGLCEALYKDLSNMTFEQLFKNTNRPVGYLFTADEYSDWPGITPAYWNRKYVPVNDTVYLDREMEEDAYRYSLLIDTIPVYAEMTNTLDFLKANGYDIPAEELKIKEILYTDTDLSFVGAKIKFIEANKKEYDGPGSYKNLLYYDYDDLMFDYSHVNMYGNDMMEYLVQDTITEYDLLKKMYSEAGHPLLSVTDTEKAREIVDNTVSQYLTLNDNGRYVYVIYEDGVMVCYYLPEANVSVVK